MSSGEEDGDCLAAVRGDLPAPVIDFIRRFDHRNGPGSHYPELTFPEEPIKKEDWMIKADHLNCPSPTLHRYGSCQCFKP